MLEFKRRVLVGRDNEKLTYVDIEIDNDMVLSIEFLNAYPIKNTIQVVRDGFDDYLYDMSMETKLDYLEKFDCRYSDFESEFIKHINKTYDYDSNKIIEYLYGRESLNDIINSSYSFKIDKLNNGIGDTRNMIMVSDSFSGYIHNIHRKYNGKEIVGELEYAIISIVRNHIELVDEDNLVANWLEFEYSGREENL